MVSDRISVRINVVRGATVRVPGMKTVNREICQCGGEAKGNMAAGRRLCLRCMQAADERGRVSWKRRKWKQAAR